MSFSKRIRASPPCLPYSALFVPFPPAPAVRLRRSCRTWMTLPSFSFLLTMGLPFLRGLKQLQFVMQLQSLSLSPTSLHRL